MIVFLTAVVTCFWMLATFLLIIFICLVYLFMHLVWFYLLRVFEIVRIDYHLIE